MWKTSIVAVLLGTSLLANAQQQPAQQVVQWQLQVMRDGQQIDSFASGPPTALQFLHSVTVPLRSDPCGFQSVM